MLEWNKRIKLVTMINMISLAGMYLLCFTNTPDDISVACEECSSGTSMAFLFGTIFIIVQGVLAMVMYSWARKTEQVQDAFSMIALAVASIFLSFLQIMVVFSNTPDVHSHEYDFTEKDLFRIDMMEVQFDVGKIISGILILLYVGLIILTLCSQPKKKKKMKNR